MTAIADHDPNDPGAVPESALTDYTARLAPNAAMFLGQSRLESRSKQILPRRPATEDVLIWDTGRWTQAPSLSSSSGQRTTHRLRGVRRGDCLNSLITSVADGVPLKERTPQVFALCGQPLWLSAGVRACCKYLALICSPFVRHGGLPRHHRSSRSGNTRDGLHSLAWREGSSIARLHCCAWYQNGCPDRPHDAAIVAMDIRISVCGLNLPGPRAQYHYRVGPLQWIMAVPVDGDEIDLLRRRSQGAGAAPGLGQRPPRAQDHAARARPRRAQGCMIWAHQPCFRKGDSEIYRFRCYSKQLYPAYTSARSRGRSTRGFCSFLLNSANAKLGGGSGMSWRP